MPYSGQSRVIPWSSFADGRWWELTPGQDHDQSARKAVNAARTWARGRGYQVETVLPHPAANWFTPWRIRFVRRAEVTTDGEAGQQ